MRSDRVGKIASHYRRKRTNIARRSTSARNPLTRRRKLTLADLVNEPWVQIPSDSLFGSMVADIFRAGGYERHAPRW